MFSTAAGGPNHGFFWSIVLFIRTLDCSELRYRFLNITVAPPECLVAGTVVPAPLCPGILHQPPSQEILVAEDHTWVFHCTKEGGLLCGAKFSTKKQLTTHIMHTQGGTRGSRSWSVRATITNVCPWCSSSPTALQRYGTYRNDWKLEPAVQKVRGLNTKQSLRRPWLVPCSTKSLQLQPFCL